MKLSRRLRGLLGGEDMRTSSVNNKSETSEFDISISDSESDASYYPSDGEGSNALQTSRFHSTSSSDSYSSSDEVPVANLVPSNQKPSSNDNVIWSKSGLPNQSHLFLTPYGRSNIVTQTYFEYFLT